VSTAATVLERLLSNDTQRTEADTQSDIKLLLLSGALQLSADQVVRLEEPTGDGTRRRLDIAVGHCVIEVKKSLGNPALVADAVEQLAGYLRTRIEHFGRRYVGILTDGRDWHLFDLIDDEMVEISKCAASQVSPEQLLGWLESILSTETAVKPTPAEIESRLGSGSPAYLLDKRELRSLYDISGSNSDVVLKRELWAKLLRTAFGSAFTDDADAFIDHTLLVITAEIIAHAVMGLDVGPTGGLDAKTLVTGAAFDEAQLFGIVEADFFDWVIDVDGGETFINSLAHRISRFDWSKVEHDVLKHLYESIISQRSRESLGEYYTPDWLADRIVADAVDAPLTQRVLDPSCGSGTFLFHAIATYLRAADDAGISNSDALAGVTRNVIGVDIHPVAATLARVTYLLAIGTDRLTTGDRPPLTIPVYLGDSVQWEQRQDLFHTEETVSISTSGEELVAGGASLGDTDLVFPRSVLKDAQTFDRLVTAMADSALDLSNTESKTIVAKIAKTFKLTDAEREIVGPTFATMRALHKAQRNHIWGFYVRNLIRPIWLSEPENRVDVLIGNPPWLRYSKMTKGMQNRYQALAKPRNLLSGGLGASARDLSTLFVVRAVELYLKPGGRFEFVMPHGTITRRPHTGFRNAIWSSKGSVRSAVAFDESWDLSGAPTGFPMVSCVVRGTSVAKASDSPVPLPLAVRIWKAKVSDPNQTWPALESQFTVTDGEIVAIDANVELPVSPYKKAFRQGAVLVPRVIFMADEVSAGPLGLAAGRIRVQSRRSSLEKGKWKELDPSPRVVESRFFHEAHFGETVVPFGVLAPRGVLVPIDDGKLLNRSEINDFPDLASWWSVAEQMWDQNKSNADSSELLERLDYLGQLSAQLPPAAHRVVYTKAGNNLAAARLSNSDAIIDQKLYWAPMASDNEARFVAALINSRVLAERTKPLQALGLFGPRDFDKAVFSVPFGRYDSTNADHLALATAAKNAEHLVGGMSLPSGFKQARKVVRERLTAAGITEIIEDLVNKIVPAI
jgi:hypothetical protein